MTDSRRPLVIRSGRESVAPIRDAANRCVSSIPQDRLEQGVRDRFATTSESVRIGANQSTSPDQFERFARLCIGAQRIGRIARDRSGTCRQWEQEERGGAGD